MLFRSDMMKQMEKSVSEALEKMMREPSFMQILSKNMGSFLDMQGLVKEQVDVVLKTYSVPTRDELDQIHSRLNRIESLLLDMDEGLKKQNQSKSTTSESAETSPKPRVVKKKSKTVAKKKGS